MINKNCLKYPLKKPTSIIFEIHVWKNPKNPKNPKKP